MFSSEGDNASDTDHAEVPIKPCCRALHRVVTGILCDRLLRRKLRPSLSALPASRYELKYMHLVDEALATELDVPETHAHVPVEAEIHSPTHPADVLGSPAKGPCQKLARQMPCDGWTHLSTRKRSPANETDRGPGR